MHRPEGVAKPIAGVRVIRRCALHGDAHPCSRAGGPRFCARAHIPRTANPALSLPEVRNILSHCH